MLCSKFGTHSSDKEVYLSLSPSQEYWLWVLLIKISCTISIAASIAASGKAFHLFLSSNSECRFFRCIMTSTGMKILWGISLPEFTPWTVVTNLSISSSVVPMRELKVVKNEIILLLAQSIFTFKMCCIKCAKDTVSSISNWDHKLIDMVSVSALTNIFECSFQRDSNIFTCPLKLLPISTATGVDHTWYIIWWPFMKKYQMKGFFTP